ncbi:hypothetical protein G6F65_017499 [Rhizopus arrhizus]|nr:hypothetical protein G6F65_017499 [Rhizopus arrhizus]
MRPRESEGSRRRTTMTTGQSGAGAPDRNRGRERPCPPRRQATYEVPAHRPTHEAPRNTPLPQALSWRPSRNLHDFNGFFTMALRATIYKAELNVADTDRHYYGSHSLTVARHPSETDERLMVRLVAYALHAQEELAFTKGLSDTDEPDLWVKDLTGAVKLWIEVGQPEERRILRACGRADEVIVYCYGGSASKIWWDGVRNKLERTRNLKVINLPSDQTRALAKLAERTMQLNANISDGIVYFSADKGEVSVEPEAWR